MLPLKGISNVPEKCRQTFRGRSSQFIGGPRTYDIAYAEIDLTEHHLLHNHIMVSTIPAVSYTSNAEMTEVNMAPVA